MQVTTSNYFFIHTFKGKLIKTYFAVFLFKITSFEKLLPQNAPIVLKIENFYIGI